MEKMVNEVMARLEGKICKKELEIVRNALFATLESYDVRIRETGLIPYQEGLPKEVKEYIVSKKIEGLSQKTLGQYLGTLKCFFSDVQKSPENIVTNDIRLYMYHLQEKGIADVTLDNYRRYINGFFEWLSDNDYIDKNPCKRLKAIKKEKVIKDPLTDCEIEKVRDNCIDLREKAIIEILYSTGCRAEELVNIKISDIDIEKREVKLHGKGKKERISYINAKALLALGDYLQSKNYTSEYVFSSNRKPHYHLSTRAIQVIVKNIGVRAGITTKVHPHRIRRTTATIGLARGMTLEQVQTLLGHEKPSTTLIYAKISQENVKMGHQKAIV